MSPHAITVGPIWVVRIPPRLAPRPPARRRTLCLPPFFFLKPPVCRFLVPDVSLGIRCLWARIKRALRPRRRAAACPHRQRRDPSDPDLLRIHKIGRCRHRRKLKPLRTSGAHWHPRPRRDQSERLLRKRHPPVFTRIVVLASEWTRRRRHRWASWREKWNGRQRTPKLSV